MNELTTPTAAPRHVRTEITDGVLTVTLDSPHNRNALSTKLVTQLHEALTLAERDETVRAVVLTHTGSTFCAGADLSEPVDAEAGQDPAVIRAEQLTQVLLAIMRLPKPVIAKVDGHVRAGGFGLVTACDVAVASQTATFALTEVRLGLAAFVVSATILPRATPRQVAALMLTGDKVDAARAAQCGVVTDAVAADELDTTVDAYLQSWRACSPQGLAATKELLVRDLVADVEASGRDLAECSAALFASEEAHEGMVAFLEKRTPRWAL